jgi:hypothetical protein
MQEQARMSGSSTIFLSYNERDRERAANVVRLLEGRGWSVWWDRRIPAGRTWPDVLADALARMDCMVVLWSRNSIDSNWVYEEASEGQRRRKLVPVALDAVLPPVGFRQIQAADLSKWNGSPDDPAARQLLDDLAALVREPTRPDAADLIDDDARRVVPVAPAAPPAERLSALRTRSLTAADSAELQRIAWEIETLQRDWPDWIEARALHKQLDEALARARRAEAVTAAPRSQAPAAAPVKASGVTRWGLGAVLALALVAALAWWLWPRPASPDGARPADPATQERLRPSGTSNLPAQPAPLQPRGEARTEPRPGPAPADSANAARQPPGANAPRLPNAPQDLAVQPAITKPATDANPVKPPATQAGPSVSSRAATLARCSELNSRLSLGEPLSAADRSWILKECQR